MRNSIKIPQGVQEMYQRVEQEDRAGKQKSEKKENEKVSPEAHNE
jgi:hypothetical protein